MSLKKLIVTEYNGKNTVFSLEDNQLTDLFFDSEGEFKVNDIYIGKVRQVKKDINACFVEIAEGVMGYLPMEDAVPSMVLNRADSTVLHENDEICVQISKEPVKTKLASLTMHLSIPGNFCVAVSDDNEIHASNKLSADDSAKLTKAFRENANSLKTGLIIRTNAGNKTFSDIYSEALALTGKLFDIVSTMKMRTVFSKVYTSKAAYISRICDSLSGEGAKIITDSQSLFDSLKEQLDIGGVDIEFYNDERITLKALYGLDKKYSEATAERVYLPSGGYLVIEPTEALTVIDVNSGKADRKKDKEDNIVMINNEAAVEIARQLRLRNLSGIILVDFINFSDKMNESCLIKTFKAELAKDTIVTKLVDITPLGLCEITRKKKYASIYEYIKK